MMPRKAKNRPPSLLDSKQYQSALKVNQIESNKLDKLKNSVESNRKRCVENVCDLQTCGLFVLKFPSCMHIFM